MPFDSETLDLYVSNNKSLLDAVQSAVRLLRSVVDRAASEAARENRQWHDDPEAEDHKDFHAPAIEQFPRSVRDETIIGLVEFHLSEMALEEEWKAKSKTST